MPKGLKMFSGILVVMAVGVFLLVSSIQTHQFRQACVQTCAAKHLRYEWHFAMIPLVVPECTCVERRPNAAAK